MFENITDLSFVRNWKQAMGFYLVSLFAAAFLVMLMGFICFTYLFSIGDLPKDPAVTMQAGVAFGKNAIPVLALLSTAFAIFVIRAKKAYSAKAFAGVCLTALLGLFSFMLDFSPLAHLILAFVPIAYLTTLPKSAPPQGT